MNVNRSSYKKIKFLKEEKDSLKKNNKIQNIFNNIYDFIEIYSNLNVTNNPKTEKTLNNSMEKELETQQETYEILIRKLESDLRNQLKVTNIIY